MLLLIYVAFSLDSPGGNVFSVRRAVAVRDVNDDIPRFLRLPYIVTVAEDTTPGSIIFSGKKLTSRA